MENKNLNHRKNYITRRELQDYEKRGTQPTVRPELVRKPNGSKPSERPIPSKEK
jgi:hypothetical protein